MKNSVGNDLVDLSSADARTFSSNTRFIDRVLNEREKKFYLERSPSVALFWMHWAAKEAVYKFIKKESGQTVFSHRLFEFDLVTMEEKTAKGTITYKGCSYPVIISLNPDWVHCTTSAPGTKEVLTLISHKNNIKSCTFTGVELASIYSQESKLVRSLAKNLLKQNFDQEYEIRRPLIDRKFGPPEIWHNGQRVPGLDLSLSHDHEFCAVAIGVSREC